MSLPLQTSSAAAVASAMDKLSDRDKEILDTIFDPLQPLGVNSPPSKVLYEGVDAEDDRLSDEVKEVVKSAISLSESGNIERALPLFDSALEKAPRSAALLNDRAQALRLAGREEEALADLNLAVEYSAGRGRAGVQALCQRAALFRCLGKEEEAKDDFARAADGGSSYAKSQLVAMNPYAAMCNAMLRKITTRTFQE